MRILLPFKRCSGAHLSSAVALFQVLHHTFKCCSAFFKCCSTIFSSVVALFQVLQHTFSSVVALFPSVVAHL